MAIPFGMIGMFIQAAGAYSQAVAQREQAERQARIQRQVGERERQEAAIEEANFRRNASRLMAKRRAEMGVSGVRPDEGSPLLVSEDFEGEIEFEALRRRAGGELRGIRAEQQAVETERAGREAGRAGFVRGGSLLVSGLGQARFGRRAA